MVNMRYFWLTLVSLLLGSTAALAQQPAPAAPGAGPDRLDEYLVRWEKEMKSVHFFFTDTAPTEKDKTFNTIKVYSGVAQYKDVKTGGKSTKLALLEMRQKDKPEQFEKFICTGTFLYQYVPQVKEIRVHELPQSKEGVADDNFLAFIFGMAAKQARERYELKLTKEDQWYIYVEVQPRNNEDKADFQKARLVLNKDTFLPRQLWFEQPNGNEVVWDIPRIQSGVPLDPKTFDTPQVPQGWQMVRVPLPPRVIRQQN